MTWSVVSGALGGLALFLWAMQAMTDGLTAAAGTGLRRLLARFTSTPLRGVAAGVLVTGLVQSSSAVTIATLGFVNAGALTLRQALGVVFGTNVGTTITGWLVATLGFGFKIEAFALPILSVGVALHLLSRGRAWQGLGKALAGFGLFFLGLALLKEAFEGVATAYASQLGTADAAPIGRVSLLGVGFLATVLTQSSSAAIALILTASAGGLLGFADAAAAVIGANLGTTSTAAFAVLRATPAAKRLALGHIVFNLLTAVIALALLPLMLLVVSGAAELLGHGYGPARSLALFHTAFNVLGVALLLPLTGVLSRLLERAFRSAEEEVQRPRFLDNTLVATPALAVSALYAELGRLAQLAHGALTAGILGTSQSSALREQSEAASALGEHIANYAARVRTETMPLAVARDLAQTLVIQRAFLEALRLSPSVRALSERVRVPDARHPQPCLLRFVEEARLLCTDLTTHEAPSETELRERLNTLATLYAQAKSALLDAVAGGTIPVTAAGLVLDQLSESHRAVSQLAQGHTLLSARIVLHNRSKTMA